MTQRTHDRSDAGRPRRYRRPRLVGVRPRARRARSSSLAHPDGRDAGRDGPGRGQPQAHGAPGAGLAAPRRARRPGRPRPLLARRRVPAAGVRQPRGPARLHVRVRAGAARSWPSGSTRPRTTRCSTAGRSSTAPRSTRPSGAVRLTSTVGGRNPAHSHRPSASCCWRTQLPDLAAVRPGSGRRSSTVARRARSTTARTCTGRLRAGAQERLRRRRPGERAGRQLPRRARRSCSRRPCRAGRSASAPSPTARRVRRWSPSCPRSAPIVVSRRPGRRPRPTRGGRRAPDAHRSRRRRTAASCGSTTPHYVDVSDLVADFDEAFFAATGECRGCAPVVAERTRAGRLTRFAGERIGCADRPPAPDPVHRPELPRPRGRDRPGRARTSRSCSPSRRTPWSGRTTTCASLVGRPSRTGRSSSGS